MSIHKRVQIKYYGDANYFIFKLHIYSAVPRILAALPNLSSSHLVV